MKISAVINCYNEIDFISYAIRSIYPFCDEIVVVDNCSTDGTQLKIKKIINEFDRAEKIRPYFLDEPMQLGKVRNFGIDKASHEWIIKWDGDFCAYSDIEHERIKPFSELIEIVRNNAENYDFFLLYSINISGDFYHYDKTRQYLGLHGDSFIGKKSCMRYETNDKYGDVGVLRKPDGTKPRFYYLNKPDNNPIYFVHLYGIKPDEYLLYRKFLSEYQVWIDKHYYKEFWDWMKEIKDINIEGGINYTAKQLIPNLEKHGFPLPSILEKELQNLKYEVIYENGSPVKRIKHETINN